MTAGVNRLNRAVLTVLGLLLSAGAVTGLALGAGARGASAAHRPLLDPEIGAYVDREPWFWWVVAATGIVVALLALTWLLAQARTDRVRQVELTAGDPGGATVVQAGAVTEAVEQEVGSYLGVANASARLRGGRTHRLDLTVEVSHAADFAELRNRLQQHTVVSLRQVLDAPDLPVHVQLRPAPEPAR
jgi:hypothetical protein